MSYISSKRLVFLHFLVYERMADIAIVSGNKSVRLVNSLDTKSNANVAVKCSVDGTGSHQTCKQSGKLSTVFAFIYLSSVDTVLNIVDNSINTTIFVIVIHKTN